MVGRNAIYPMTAGFDLTETYETNLNIPKQTLNHCETTIRDYCFVSYSKMKIVKMMMPTVSFFLYKLKHFSL